MSNLNVPKFSIIVPIYNVEKYLSQCIESVSKQTFSDYELILVDDGSPDGSGAICDKTAANNSHVRVIHKENGGLSSARNAGLDIASGQYIIFLDSDDFWTDANALETISQRLNETDADILVFPARRYYEDSNSYTDILSGEVERDRITDTDVHHAIHYMLENNIYRAAAWNKVIRRDLIVEHSMRFKNGYLSEDMDWCGDLLIYAKRFDYYEVPLYAYRQQRTGSITKNKSEKLVADKLYMCQKGLAQAQALEDSEKQKLLASYYAYEYAVTLGVSSGIHKRELLRQMKELRVLLNYDISQKVKKVNKLKRFLGYGLTRKALCFFVRIKH